ncbi:MAG: phosphate ABC transporter substrate-binding protein PstS [Planctomycetes bacterium]|nr:phosphate ABC transporter substrate-binding protein PstS [Planctomycetota bacterium]MCB9887138.1 phosphate ABC transporter substrate-binding protein PstS [Planctomycetota bacterium]
MLPRNLLLSASAAAALTLGACSDSSAAEAVTLSGSGASFPAPLYQTWFAEYGKSHPNRVNYTSKGSSGGKKDVIEGIVDFGASDSAMKDEEIAKVDRGIQLLPMTAGGVVLIYNLDNVRDLKLSRDSLAGIYLGEITKWNDDRIKADNAGVALPDVAIQPVYRADGSGTTFCFSNHLAAASQKWQSGPGAGESLNWPVGTGGKKNDGVAALVKQTPGAIGYVELSFAKTAGMPMASLQNKAGKFVAPSIANFQAALAGATLPANMRTFLPDPDGEQSYPIVTYTWILAYKSYPKAKLDAFKDAMRWCLTTGQGMSEKLGYVPLPEAVTSKVIAALDQLQAK